MLFGATVLIATQFYLIVFNMKLQVWCQEQFKAPFLQGYTKNLLNWESISSRRKLHLLSQFYKIVKNLAPNHLSKLLPKLSSERTHYRLRSRENLTQFPCRTSRFQKSFFPSAINGWNSLNLDVRNSVSLPILLKLS